MTELADLVGRRTVVGITIVDEDNDVVEQFQLHGTIVRADEGGVVLERPDGRPFGLPPGRELFEEASPGEYRLRSTGETVIDPDLLVSLSVTARDPSDIDELRNHGYLPPGA